LSVLNNNCWCPLYLVDPPPLPALNSGVQTLIPQKASKQLLYSYSSQPFNVSSLTFLYVKKMLKIVISKYFGIGFFLAKCKTFVFTNHTFQIKQEMIFYNFVLKRDYKIFLASRMYVPTNMHTCVSFLIVLLCTETVHVLSFKKDSTVQPFCCVLLRLLLFCENTL